MEVGSITSLVSTPATRLATPQQNNSTPISPAPPPGGDGNSTPNGQFSTIANQSEVAQASSIEGNANPTVSFGDAKPVSFAIEDMVKDGAQSQTSASISENFNTAEPDGRTFTGSIKNSQQTSSANLTGAVSGSTVNEERTMQSLAENYVEQVPFTAGNTGIQVFG